METTTRTFAQNFGDCCAASCGNLVIEKVRTHPNYRENAEERHVLYEEIKSLLGDDRKLINRFDAAKNVESALDSEYVYQQGFHDCVYLLRWVGLL